MADTKENPRGGSELITKEGKTVIADEVVAKIVALATKEIQGVHDMGTFGLGDSISGLATGLAQKVGQTGQSTQGVNVEVGEREVAADIKIVVEYGVSIPQVATAVRRSIISRVHSMTGLTVKEINIDISDLYFAEEAKKPSEKPHVPRVE